MKEKIHQNILGKRLVESETKSWNEFSKLRYYNLVGNEAEIISIYLYDGSVKVLIRDSEGNTAEVFATLFQIKD